MVLFTREQEGWNSKCVVAIVFSMLCCNHGVHQVTLAPMIGHWVWVGGNNHVGHAAGVGFSRSASIFDV